MTIATINPATGQTLRTFVPLSEPELDARLQCAADTFRRYRRTPIAERSRLLVRAMRNTRKNSWRTRSWRPARR